MPLTAPVHDFAITSPFGYRSDPFNGEPRIHEGIDLQARSAARCDRRRRAAWSLPAGTRATATWSRSSTASISARAMPISIASTSP